MSKLHNQCGSQGLGFLVCFSLLLTCLSFLQEQHLPPVTNLPIIQEGITDRAVTGKELNLSHKLHLSVHTLAALIKSRFITEIFSTMQITP